MARLSRPLLDATTQVVHPGEPCFGAASSLRTNCGCRGDKPRAAARRAARPCRAATRPAESSTEPSDAAVFELHGSRTSISTGGVRVGSGPPVSKLARPELRNRKREPRWRRSVPERSGSRSEEDPLGHRAGSHLTDDPRRHRGRFANDRENPPPGFNRLMKSDLEAIGVDPVQAQYGVGSRHHPQPRAPSPMASSTCKPARSSSGFPRPPSRRGSHFPRSSTSRIAARHQRRQIVAARPDLERARPA